jgi:hypothetical protein
LPSKAFPGRIGALVVGIGLLLGACGSNTYGPPPDGRPTNWGQQHYLDVQKYRQLNENRMR